MTMFEHEAPWLDRRFYLDATAQTWSATDAGGTLTSQPVQATVDGSDSVGWLVPGLEVLIWDTADSQRIRAIVTAVSSDQKQADFRALSTAWTATDSVADNDPIWNIGSAFEEGSGAAEPTSDELTLAYGSTQIFKNAFAVTNTLQATHLFGGEELARLRAQKENEHKMDIERMLVFGERKGNRATAAAHLMGTTHNIRTSDGFIACMEYMDGLSDSWDHYMYSITMSTYTFDSFVDDMAEVFEYGSDTKLALCGSGVLGYFSKLGSSGFLNESQVRITLEPGAEVFGVKIQKLITPHGTLVLTPEKILRGGSADGNYQNYMMVVDLPNVSIRPLKGRDTHMETAVQNNDEDLIKDQFLTETGFALKNPKTHSLWIFS